MLRKFGSHMRDQWMGAAALFLVLGGGTAYAANTVFSTDIVNNEVYGADVRDDTLAGGGLGNVDLKAGAVRSSEVSQNSLTGGDIDESTLEAPGRILGVGHGSAYSDDCSDPGKWSECAKVTIDVPANKTYGVAIDSAGSFGSFDANLVRICSSVRKSTTPFDGTTPFLAGCNVNPTGIILSNDLGPDIIELESVSTNAVQQMPGGPSGATYIVSTAINADFALERQDDYDYGTVHTNATIFDVTSGGPRAAGIESSGRLKR